MEDTVDTTEASAVVAVAQWLRDASNADDVHITRYEKLPGGAIQENWTLDAEIVGGPWSGRHGLVLRKDAASGVAASRTRAEEFEILRVAHAAGVIAPKPLFLCRDRSVLDGQFFVMERLPGLAQGHRLTREPALVPDGNALAHALGANLARIHSIHPPRAELSSILTMPGNPALDTIAEYRAYLDGLDDAYPALEWGLRWCERHAPSTFDITLIHRDYRTGNYLVDHGRLCGVLDWEFAGWGDPREDLGWFTARCWRFNGPDREAGGIAPLDPFLDGYASIAKRRISREELDYWQVMAHLRWGVIALQQAQRHIAGGERSLELALTGRIVHELEYEVLQLIARSQR